VVLAGTLFGGWQKPLKAGAHTPDTIRQVHDLSFWVRYDINWTTMSPMPTPRAFAGVALAKNGKIYVVGGSTETEDHISLATFEEYDIVSDQWAARADLPVALQGAAAVGADNGKIYVMGGEHWDCLGMPPMCGWYYSWNFYEYNPETNSWTAKSGGPRVHGPAAVYASNGKIYTFGGFGTDVQSCVIPMFPRACGQDVEEYDPLTDTWTPKALMPTPRFLPAAVQAQNGRIYVVGGQFETPIHLIYNTVEEYDPVTDTWQSRTPLPFGGLAGLAAVSASNGRIYVFGGYGFNEYYWTNSVFEYNPANDTWRTLATNFTARAGPGAVITADDKIFAIGGNNPELGLLGLNQMGNLLTLPDHTSFIPAIFR
jgi:N-acetylneuraminic acid mutarotase